MPASELDKKKIDSFFTSIAPVAAAYQGREAFSYLAVKQDNAFVLTQARVFLNTAPSATPFTHFVSPEFRAGNYALAELKLSPTEILAALLNGELPTPGGPLRFPAAQSAEHTVMYHALHSEGLKTQTRLEVLTVAGANRSPDLGGNVLDWMLRAAPTPYDGVQDLLNEYSLGILRHDMISIAVEFVAFNVAAVDAVSTMSGTTARLAIRVATGLTTDAATLGVRTWNKGKVLSRELIRAGDMTWVKGADAQVGSIERQVPAASLLYCVASYAGVAQHFYWIADPASTENPRRAAFEAWDPQLEILKGFLGRSEVKGRDARDLEVAVAWLLWSLGFGVAHLGAVSKTQDAPDLLVTTPRGDFAVVECTTRGLGADSKLPRLVERTDAVKVRLAASGNGHLRVIPVMITSLSRDEARVDLETAQKLGVVVLTRESLDEAVNRSLIISDPQQLYEQIGVPPSFLGT